MTERMNLNMEDLEMVTGGIWNFDTLTEEEQAEYDALNLECMEAVNLGYSLEYMMVKIQNFNERMNAKYGPN